MKKSIILGFLWLFIALLTSCQVPFDKQQRIVSGVLVVDEIPIEKYNPLADEGLGLWLYTTNESYFINNANHGSVPKSVCVGEIMARAGDSIKAYGTSESYRDYQLRVYHRMTLDSISVLKSREERTEITEDFVVTGPLNIEHEDDVSIATQYQLKRSCYTYKWYDWSNICIQVAGQEFCMHGNNIYDTVEAHGTLYYRCDDLGKMIYEIDVKKIRKL